MAHIQHEERPSAISFDEEVVFDPQGDVILRLQKMPRAETPVTSQSLLEPDDHQEPLEPEANGGGFTTPTTISPQETFIDHARSNVAIDGRAPEPEREDDATFDNTQNIYLRVSSRHLVLASSVFNVMLDPNKFAEGNALRSQESLTIPLSDDPEALIILMHIVHGMTRKVPRVVNLDTLSKLAKLVDYYALHEVVELFSDTWVANLKEKTFPKSYTPDVVPWLFISWVFHQRDAFFTLTQILICECDSKSIDSIDHEDIPIPLPITNKIQEHRVKAIGNIITAVHDRINTYLTAKIICSRGGDQACDANVLGPLLKGSAVLGIWPRPDVPYHGIVLRDLAIQIRKMHILDMCTQRTHYQSFNHGVKEMIEASLKSVEDQFRGLSLDSFLRGPQNKKKKWKDKKKKKALPLTIVE